MGGRPLPPAVLRPLAFALFAALVLAALLGPAQAGAAGTLGSPDPSLTPERYWCDSTTCPGADTGLRQLGLSGALVEAPEDGVLVSARAYAKRISGTSQPRIVVLRPAAGIGATTVTSAPMPVSSAAGALASVADLHLAVQAGDAIGFLFPTGEVDLGARNRPNPDGAVVTFSSPCAPCGQDGGTGTELLFDGTVEPDVDADLLGDETQDPDGGGALDDYQPDPLFDDDPFFDEDEETDDPAAKPHRRLRLLRVRERRDGGINLLLAVPRPGRLAAGVKARIPIAATRKRVKKAGRVRLALSPSRGGRRLLARHHGPLRARLTVTLKPGKGRPRSLKAPVKLGGLLPKRSLDRPLARLE